MKYLRVIFLSLLCLAVGLTAPFVVPFALLFTKRDAKSLPRAFAWYDTPDEPELIGLGEASVQAIYDKYGWFAAAWNWFGIRNRAHGFKSMFSEEAPGYWPFTEGYGEQGDFFYWRKHIPMRWFALHLSFGWAAYRSPKYSSGVEYRPMLAVKTRKLVDD